MLPGSGFQFCRRRRSTKQKCRLQKRQIKFLTSTKQFHISGNYECLGMSGYKLPDEQHRQNFWKQKTCSIFVPEIHPIQFRRDFCCPTRKLPSDTGCGFLHPGGHLRKCLRRVSQSSLAVNFLRLMHSYCLQPAGSSGARKGLGGYLLRLTCY